MLRVAVQDFIRLPLCLAAKRLDEGNLGGISRLALDGVLPQTNHLGEHVLLALGTSLIRKQVDALQLQLEVLVLLVASVCPLALRFVLLHGKLVACCIASQLVLPVNLCLVDAHVKLLLLLRHALLSQILLLLHLLLSHAHLLLLSHRLLTHGTVGLLLVEQTLVRLVAGGGDCATEVACHYAILPRSAPICGSTGFLRL